MSKFKLEVTIHEVGDTHGYWIYCNDVKQTDKEIVDLKYKELIDIPFNEFVSEFIDKNDKIYEEGLWELGNRVTYCKLGTSACDCKTIKTPINGKLVIVDDEASNKKKFLNNNLNKNLNKN